MVRGINRRDALVPAVLAALSTIELITLDVERPLAPIALQVVACALLVLRRRWPWAASTAAGVLSALMPYLGTELDEPAVPILIIGLACWTTGRHLDDWRGASSVGLFLLAILSDYSAGGHGFNVSDLAFVTIILVPPYLAGVGARTLVARNRRLAEQAEELLRLQALVRQEAAAAERGRIARELHDIIAHSVSAMVVQASAASTLLEHDPTRARQAVDDVATTGRQALAETGRLLHLLRDEAGELGLAPDTGMEGLPDLVAEFTRRGLHVELSVEGPMTGLPPGVGLSAYRIVQEALTNARKHGLDANARVCVQRHDRMLRIRAENLAGPRGPSSGLGLVGMAERVSVFGGQLSYGVSEDGVFLLDAELPLLDSA